MALKYVNDLIPVVVQDYETKDVLMVAYANEKALELTKETGFAHYFSRSRSRARLRRARPPRYASSYR